MTSSVFFLSRELAVARTRTRKAMVVSVLLHGLLVIALVLARNPSTEREFLTEITWVDEEEVAAPPAPAVAPPEVIPAPMGAENAPPPQPSERSLDKADAEPPPPSPRPDAGHVGRERAKAEVAASLRGATQAADNAVSSLQTALGKTAASDPRPSGRRRSMSQARGAGDVAAVGGHHAGTVGHTDLAGSAVISSGIHVEPLGWTTGGDGTSVTAVAAGVGASGAGGPMALAGRTQASLMTVVRRNAPGIQFCYDNELKRFPGLRGKVVVAITVAAPGQVLEARRVSDTLGRAELSDCMLAQIRSWKFPAVPQGTVTFQAPFVFTPPKG